MYLERGLRNKEKKKKRKSKLTVSIFIDCIQIRLFNRIKECTEVLL
jgi:hypothetical protein